MIKALGYTTGRLAAVGSDADLLAGVPPRPGDTPPDSVGLDLVLQGPLPDAQTWPHHDLSLTQSQPEETPPFDVDILAIPHCDTRFISDTYREGITEIHHDAIDEELRYMRLGGLLIALTHREFLDGPADSERDSIAQHADLLGAVRLPAAALRSTPQTDSPVDVLVLRHREPWEEPAGRPFTRRVQIELEDSSAGTINQVYADHPDQVCGRVQADPANPLYVTVTHEPAGLDGRLRRAMGSITTFALEAGLTATYREPRIGAQISPTDLARIVGPPDEPRRPGSPDEPGPPAV